MPKVSEVGVGKTLRCFQSGKQVIPDTNYVNVPLEQYDGIAHMICATLAEGQHTDPDKSVLIRAGVKLDHLETYTGGSDLKEFKVFIAGILRWLKMNCLPGEASTDMQVNYLGTCHKISYILL